MINISFHIGREFKLCLYYKVTSFQKCGLGALMGGGSESGYYVQKEIYSATTNIVLKKGK